MADVDGDDDPRDRSPCSAGPDTVPAVTDVLPRLPGAGLRSLAGIDIERSTSRPDAYIGMFVGGACSLIGIGAAFYLYMVAPGSTLRLRDRFRPIHDFLLNQSGTSTS